MTHISRKSLIGTFALVASLSAPLAFAQSSEASAEATSPTEVTAQTETAAQDATAATSTENKSWSDVDADQDGKLTKTEAAAVPALAQVFDQVDSNADGVLTADEYKAYVAKVEVEGATGAEGTKK